MFVRRCSAWMTCEAGVYYRHGGDTREAPYLLHVLLIDLGPFVALVPLHLEDVKILHDVPAARSPRHKELALSCMLKASLIHVARAVCWSVSIPCSPIND